MEARQFIVEEREAGSRLDKWLTQKMPEFSRGQIKHLLDHGKILVNHRRVLIAGWELEPQDCIEVRMPIGGVPELLERPERAEREPTVPEHDRFSRWERKRERTPKEQPSPKEQPRGRRERRFLEVLFEDRDLLVVQKPAGILTEPKRDSPQEHLLSWVKSYLKRRHPGSRGSYVKLLHRLDKDTSGVVVVAKSKVGEQLEDQFRSHKIDRQYLAVAEGRVEKEEGSIRLPLEKGDFRGGRKVQVAREGEGLRAITNYRVQERYETATLLQLQVATGRTHQIRVHLAEIGHPIIGDTLYGAGKISFPRQALHSFRLTLQHPRTGRKMRFEAKLPEDLRRLVDQLRGS